MQTSKYKDIFRKFILPFTDDLWCFAVIFLLITTPDISFSITRCMFNCAFYNIVWNFALTYLLTLIISILQPRLIKRIVTVVVLTAIVAMTGIDFVSVFSHKTLFNTRIASSIVLTTPEEAAEFWHWGVSMSSVVAIAVFILVLAGVLAAIRRFTPDRHRWFKVNMCIFLAFSVCFCIFRPMTYDQSYIAKIGIWEKCIENLPPDLEGYTYPPALKFTDPTFENCDDFKLVFIIGESLSAKHIPFYGYEKNSMPRLSERVDSGNLICFKNVFAPATCTALAFPLILTDKESIDDPARWWEHIKVTDVFKSAGYRMNWISNQSKNSSMDGAQIAFSKLCDNAVFTMDRHEISYTTPSELLTNYDELIFPCLKDMHDTDTTRTLYLINLFGCHHKFDCRYPPEFRHFSPADYADHIESQRATLAAYDNAVYYNDFVVDSIIRQFSCDDALILYFPDHGLDIFDTRPDYAYNGIESDPESVLAATKIPLMIAMTDKYKLHHPATAEKIARSNVDGFKTTNAIYLLMDVCGLRFADNDRVAIHSPLNTD